MAEEVKQDVGPPPWEMDMNPVLKKAGEVVDTMSAVASAGIKKLFPWEMDFGGKRDLQAPPAPVAPQKGSYSFEQVFNRLVGAESKGRHTDASGALTTSPVGAQGITQVMPKTGKVPGYGVTPIQNNSKEEYLRFGKDYLRAMLREFDGDYEKAVAAYNAGAGSVKKAITKGGDNWKNFLPKRSETLPYLNKILGVK